MYIPPETIETKKSLHGKIVSKLSDLGCYFIQFESFVDIGLQ